VLFLFQLISLRRLRRQDLQPEVGNLSVQEGRNNNFEGALNLKTKTASLRVFEAWFSPEILGKCRGGDLGSLFGDVGSTQSYFPP